MELLKELLEHPTELYNLLKFKLGSSGFPKVDQVSATSSPASSREEKYRWAGKMGLLAGDLLLLLSLQFICSTLIHFWSLKETREGNYSFKENMHVGIPNVV